MKLRIEMKVEIENGRISLTRTLFGRLPLVGGMRREKVLVVEAVPVGVLNPTSDTHTVRKVTLRRRNAERERVILVAADDGVDERKARERVLLVVAVPVGVLNPLMH
jgi:hypothetical protein